ncbi:MAG: amidohydrolase family protein, partial [Nevskia sp.]|nr:amidohydrolase family protein [Nevskia sp.]
MARIVFRNANVLDGSAALGAADVVVEGERIRNLVRLPGRAAQQHGDLTYDLQGKTLMPGMVAGHGHLSFHGLTLARFMDVDMRHPAPYMGVVAAKNARKTLEAGFTTYVGAGAIHNLDVVLKDLIADGVVNGPRIVPCSRDFVPTGHAVDYKPEHWNVRQTALGGLGAVCDGPEEFRKEIRLEAKRGVQMIKIYPEGGHGLPNRTVRLGYDEIAAAVETAQLCGLRVRAHAYSKATIKACLRAGVSIVDHGDHLDEELAGLFVEHGTYVLPSLYLAKRTAGVYHSQAQLDEWFDYARKSLPMGVKAGVKFVCGDDFGLLEVPHGDNAKELALYVEELGLPAPEVIKWATANGAEMSQIPETGRIAEGFLADIVVVDGDPLKRIGVLTEPERIALVMKGGVVA